MPKCVKDFSYSEQHVLERYVLHFGPDDYLVLNHRIQHALVPISEDSETPEFTDSPTLLNDEGGEQIWGVPWAAQTLVCVWSKDLARVTTLLPEGTVVTRRKGSK